MPDRVQVKDLYKDRGYLPEAQGTASPVDTFVNPGKPVIKDIRLLEFASAWQDVEPGLSQFAQQRIEKVNQEDAEAGRKAALANKAQFKDAVNKGLIPAGASPWFQMAYERQQATRSVLEYDQAMKDAYAKTNLADDADPEAISRWMTEFTQGWLETNEVAKSNPEFSKVFSVVGAQSQDNLQSIHAAERTKKIEQGLVDDTDFMLGAVLDRSFDLLGNNNPHLSEELATIVGEQVANGLSGQVANKLVTEAVVRKALAERDITILDVLDKVPSGSGVVGNIGWVQKEKEAARLQIAAINEHQNRLDHAAKKEQREQIINQVRGQAYLKIAENPYADVTPEFQALAAVDPDEAAKLESFRTAYLGSKNAQNKVIESNPLKTEMLLRALKGDLSEADVALSVENGLIDYETAKDLLTNHMANGRDNRALVQDPIVQRFEKSISAVITKNELADELADQRAFRASEATAFFLKDMIHFKQANPNAGPLEILRRAKEAQREALDLFREEAAEPLPSVDLNRMDPTKDKLFSDAQAFNEALAEAQKTNGESGKLRVIADQYQMNLASLINAQRALYTSTQPKK